MEHDLIQKIYQDFLSKHGDPSLLWPQWCAPNKDENLRELVALGAILVQRTSWRNADIALRNLKKQKLLSLKSLARVSDPSSLIPHTKPAGFHQTKPRRLTEFSTFVTDTYGSLTNMASRETSQLRSQLLDVYGIGPETADVILLYALDQPSFVIDAYTRRWLEKNGYAFYDKPYDELQTIFESSLPKETKLFQDFHIFFIRDQKDEKSSSMEIV